MSRVFPSLNLFLTRLTKICKESKKPPIIKIVLEVSYTLNYDTGHATESSGYLLKVSDTIFK